MRKPKAFRENIFCIEHKGVGHKSGRYVWIGTHCCFNRRDTRKFLHWIVKAYEWIDQPKPKRKTK
jgi:hypothetical protein